jgi:hypothetical protein
MIILYVDNIQYFGESLNNIFDIEYQLEQIFKMTNTGDIIFYLGMNIYYDREAGIYHFNQSNYIEQMLKLYHYTDIKTAPTLTGSASIPEASIPYRYRIVLVNIARIDSESIQY